MFIRVNTNPHIQAKTQIHTCCILSSLIKLLLTVYYMCGWIMDGQKKKMKKKFARERMIDTFILFDRMIDTSKGDTMPFIDLRS
jgi:hypothetical protein